MICLRDRSNPVNHWRVVATAGVAFVLLAGNAALAGGEWQEGGVPACSVTGPQESPYIVGVGSGTTIVTWADTRDLDYDIYAQKLDADGNPLWISGGVKVCGADYDQQFPAVVDDGAGGAIVVWQDGRLGDDGLDLYAQRVLSNGAVAWQVDGIPVCAHESGLTDPPMAFSHVITNDGSGGLVVAWRDTRSDPVSGNTEIYAQKVSIAGAVGWTLNGVKILGFGTQKWSTRNPVIASDGSGGAVIAWQDARTSATTANDLYVQRITAAGSVAWAANGEVVCNAAGEQGYPDIVGMGDGTSVIVWEDKRSGNYDIFAQKFSASGAAQWGLSGGLICSSANDQRTPRVVRDESGGAVIAWTDKRNSTLYTDVFAQRLNSSGSAMWDEQGRAVCTAVGSQTRVRMALSVSGYTILTWMDTRSEAILAVYDIYGQMIDSAAVPQWAVNGIPVAAITGNNQRMHQVSADGEGSLCAVWEDDRNVGDWDVYAQKMSPWMIAGGIADAKSLPAQSPVSLPAYVVTGAFDGYFYIQDADSFAGVRVVYSDPPAAGTLVKVSGTLGSGPEPWIQAYSVRTQGSDDMPKPIGLSASRLGSVSVGNVSGLSNVGLLVRAWGLVVSEPQVGQPYFGVTDGSRELRIYSTASVRTGDFVVATGICAGDDAMSGTTPAMLTRTPDDVAVQH